MVSMPPLPSTRRSGFEVVGTVPETKLGRLTMLKPPDDEFVTIELVSSMSGRQDVDLGNGMSHLAVQIDAMDEALNVLRQHHVEVGEPTSPDGTAGFRACAASAQATGGQRFVSRGERI